jgi:hypothetical protein
MVGSFPLWEWDRTARQEPRPPEDSVVRLGRSLALPRRVLFGSAGASPSQDGIARLGGSLALLGRDCTARREPRPPEGNRGDLLQDNTRWLPPAACHGMSLQLVLFLSFVVKLPHTAHFSFC